MTPTLKRQMSSLPLVSQETWGTSYDKIKKKIGLISETIALHVQCTWGGGMGEGRLMEVVDQDITLSKPATANEIHRSRLLSEH